MFVDTSGLVGLKLIDHEILLQFCCIKIFIDPAAAYEILLQFCVVFVCPGHMDLEAYENSMKIYENFFILFHKKCKFFHKM